jgi:uncharacterized protein (DUF1810 family)
MTDDPFELRRFVKAQNIVLAEVLAELSAGRKTSHWMWFVFPQIAGLGASTMSQRYAISSMAEAKAYLSHELLGPRLAECAGLVLGHAGRSAHEIFGSPDDMKLQASMTLFARAGGEQVFQEVLRGFYGGREHEATLARLVEAQASQT